MKYSLFVVLFFISSLVYSQATPQWLFPIWFEYANGDRDTVYIGYDPSAGLPGEFEDEFEDYSFIDTSKFNVLVSYGFASPYTGLYNIDSGKNTEISGILPMSANIDFIHGQMPITMSWDMSLFYSNDLPYTNLAPYPTIVGWVYCGAGEPGYVNCPSAFDDDPLVMTDSINLNYFYPITSPHVFEGSGVPPFDEPEEVLSSFFIEFEPYHIYDAINVVADNETLQVSPNPFTDKISVFSSSSIELIEVLTTTGELIESQYVNNQKILLYTSNYPKGIYIISIVTPKKRISTYLIKQ